MTDYCTISVQFSTPDRGRVWFQWRVTRELANQILADYRERFGEAHQEAMLDADTIDEGTRNLFSGRGVVWVDHAAEAES